MPIAIRSAVPGDAIAISELVVATLRASNSKDYSPEVIKRVERSFSPQKMTALIATRDVFVASTTDAVIGTASLERPAARTVLVNPANAPFIDNAMSVLKSLESGQTVNATEIDLVLMPLFTPHVRRFLISELTLEPTALLSRFDKPVLIVQGLRDIQVGLDDAERLKLVSPQAELAFVANANHVLKVVQTDDRNENIATYSNPNLPLAEGVVDVISA